MDVDRRRLFGVAAAGAVMATAVPAGASARISCEKGDPGERLYAQLCGDGKTINVYLNGREAHEVVTADPGEGWIKRAVTTPAGNIAFNPNTGEVLYETVRGQVRWEAVDGVHAVRKAKAPNGTIKRVPHV